MVCDKWVSRHGVFSQLPLFSMIEASGSLEQLQTNGTDNMRELRCRSAR